ncbi:MAG: hypothetical protein J4N66_09625, partial [Chloroflexi bacterium]|nr:hypothetical protein [Chloroflexota bacterium]
MSSCQWHVFSGKFGVGFGGRRRACPGCPDYVRAEPGTQEAGLGRRFAGWADGGQGRSRMKSLGPSSASRS